MTPSIRRRCHLTASRSIRRGSIRRRSVFVGGAQVAILVVGRVGHAATMARIGRGVAAIHTAQQEAKSQTFRHHRVLDSLVAGTQSKNSVYCSGTFTDNHLNFLLPALPPPNLLAFCQQES